MIVQSFHLRFATSLAGNVFSGRSLFLDFSTQGGKHPASREQYAYVCASRSAHVSGMHHMPNGIWWRASQLVQLRDSKSVSAKGRETQLNGAGSRERFVIRLVCLRCRGPKLPSSTGLKPLTLIRGRIRTPWSCCSNTPVMGSFVDSEDRRWWVFVLHPHGSIGQGGRTFPT